MSPSKLKLSLANFTNGGPCILKSVAPAHPYRDGKPVLTEITGRKVTVVLPENEYETQTVTVSDPTDALSPLLAKATASRPIYVEFSDFEARIYCMRDRPEPFIGAKASAVRVVQPENEIDVLSEEF